MLGWLTSQWRRRVASLLVVLYALCLAAPTAFLAFSDGSAPAHCLTDDHHGIGTNHVHQDGSSHHHSSTGDDDRGQPGKCCGLFCLSALAPADDFAARQHPPVAHPTSLFAASLSGRTSDRIDRPPRSLLSL
jgi:hypothetical protein